MRVASWRSVTCFLFALCALLALVRWLSQPVIQSAIVPIDYIYVDAFLVHPDRFPNMLDGTLPDLSKLKWPVKQLAKQPAGLRSSTTTSMTLDSNQPLPEPFEPVMSRGQRELCERLLSLFSKLMFQNGLGNKFMLYGGTLIGSFRHHDLVPWDDDLDLLVDERVRPQVQQILRRLAPDYRLTVQRDRDKFHTRVSRNTDQDETDLPVSRRSSRFSWGWPYLDIGYYRQNETHVTEIASSYGRVYSFPKDIVFPPRLRPLGKQWYPTPYKTLEFLRLIYGEGDQCVIYGYSHVLEGYGPSGEQPCANLSSRYAFVEHRAADHSNIVLIGSSRVTDQFVLGQERLVYRDSNGQTRTVHTLHLPVLESETRVNTYGFGERNQLV